MISTQVLHEFVVAALRKLLLPPDIVRERVRLYSRFEVVGASAAAVLDALDLHTLRKISFWDALILQAARQSGCVRVLTEALQDGATIAGVRVVNPFTADAAAPASQAPRRPRPGSSRRAVPPRADQAAARRTAGSTRSRKHHLSMQRGFQVAAHT